uniref:hypothetical protein n=1 Tax=Tessaracoccus bendigoensis TaxID=72764 RepID=UPI001114A51E|nr:hypothetical protein [Tessaracoccus bendigoensis]
MTSPTAGIDVRRLVSSPTAGIDAGSLVTSMRLATGCPHGVSLETTPVLLIGVDTSDLWPIPAVSLDTCRIPLVTSPSTGIDAGTLVSSLCVGDAPAPDWPAAIVHRPAGWW